MGDELDPEVYSNVSIAGKPLTWRELCEKQIAEIAKLQAFRTIVTDLDRNKNGRHEGDVDVGEPSGISEGNPIIQTGEILGYDIGGFPYVMPARKDRHDPSAWIKRS